MATSWWAETIAAPRPAALAIVGGRALVTQASNDSVVASPRPALLALVGGQPDVVATANQLVSPRPGLLALAGGQAAIQLSQAVLPLAAQLAFVGGQPLVTVSDNQLVTPLAAALAIVGGRPLATVSDNPLITPRAAPLAIVGASPALLCSLRPSPAPLAIVGGQPSVVITQQLTEIGYTSTLGTSGTIPTHQAGDLILVTPFARNSGTTPTKPTAAGTVPAWVDIDNSSGPAVCALRTAYFVALNSSTTTGAWTGAASVMVSVYRGQAASPIGGHAVQGNTGLDSTAPAITLSDTSGKSKIVHLHGARSGGASVVWGAAPAGYTQQLANGAHFVACDTKDVTTSDGAETKTRTAGTTGYHAATVEILSA